MTATLDPPTAAGPPWWILTAPREEVEEYFNRLSPEMQLVLFNWIRSQSDWRATPGTLAMRLDPSTIQTPALALIDRAFVGLIDSPVPPRGGVRGLIISQPPQTGKTERVTRRGTTWLLVRNPDTRIGLISYDQENVRRISSVIRADIDTFNGEDGNLDLGLRRRRGEDAATRWNLAGARGGVLAIGVGGALSGKPLDCLHGDMRVVTTHGYTPIRDLYQKTNPPKVLSVNHRTGRSEWRSIVARRRIPQRAVLEILTTGGRRLVCTPDHRIFSGGRYTEARFLRRGDDLQSNTSMRDLRNDPDLGGVDLPQVLERGDVPHSDLSTVRQGVSAPEMRGVKATADVLQSGMQQPVASSRTSVPRVWGGADGQQAQDKDADLRQVLLQRDSSIDPLLSMRSVISQGTGRDEQKTETRTNQVLLRPRVPIRRTTHWSSTASVRLLWRTSRPDRAEVLQSGMRQGSSTTEEKEELSAVWRGVRILQCAASVLRSNLRQRRSLVADGGDGQLSVQGWDQLCQPLSSDASVDQRARRRRLSGMRVPRAITDSSHRRNAVAQPARESDHGMQDMSWCPPQIETDTVSVVRPIRGERHDVYDIQVEGNGNFFAEEIRVHNCLIIDDPVRNYKDADSELLSNDTWIWWQSVARPRLGPGLPVILVSTRWSDLDLAGRLMAKQREDEESGIDQYDEWQVINIPAQADHNPALGETDALGREPGEWMISARGTTPQQWEATKNATASPRVWSALYQGHPAPLEGGEVKRAWWRYSDVLPESPSTWLSAWDTKMKETRSGDYIVGGMWGRLGSKYYLYAVMRGQWDFATVQNAIALMSIRYPLCQRHIIENTGNGPEVMRELRKADPDYEVSDEIASELQMTDPERVLVQLLRRRGISGLIPETPRGSKVARMRAQSGAIEAGDVILPGSDEHHTQRWVTTFVDELSAFGVGGSHDDQADMCSMALKYLSQGTDADPLEVPQGRLPAAPKPGDRPTGGRMPGSTRQAQIVRQQLDRSRQPR